MASPARCDTAALVAQEMMQQQMPRVVKLELILTEACNLGCNYCFEYGFDSRRMMDPAMAVGAVEFLVKASRNSERIGITFIGGEPMLCFDLVWEVVVHAKKQREVAGKQISLDMTTNGTLLNKEHLRFFHREGVRYCLSLDGKEEDHDRHRKMRTGKGSFAAVAAKMRLLKRYQHWQGTRMTIMPDTASRLRENVQALHEEHAINQFILGFATHVPWTDQQIADYNQGLKDLFEYYLEQRIGRGSTRIRIGLLEVGDLDEAYSRKTRSRWGCGAGSGLLAVAPDGTFHGCSKLAWTPEGGNPPLPLGSVQAGISNWQNRSKLLEHGLDVRKKCRSCELAHFCGGGCYAANYADTGDIYRPSDTYCKLIFAQKSACDYGRGRLRKLGLTRSCWKSNPEAHEAKHT